MKTILPFLTLTLITITCQSQQVINRFTWETNPVTTADNGPNAISVSAAAVASSGGVSNTKGLNPGPGNVNIDLVLNGTPFNVPALDIAVDFRREETQASFFYRGSYFDFGINSAKLEVNFKVITDNGTSNVNSGSIYDVPDDHSFHNYRFHYDNNTGIAKVYVDGDIVYTYNGTPGASLYWTGAGNVTIGKNMDATGRNLAVLDNLIIQNPSAAAILPCTLLSFTADTKNKYSILNWNTTKEINVIRFIVERSSNAADFCPVKSMKTAGGYNIINRYLVTDSIPLKGMNYYRLKLLTADGKYSYSTVITLNNTLAADRTEITTYPNPAVDMVTLRLNHAQSGQYRYTVTSLGGQPIASSSVQLNSGAQQIRIDLSKTTVKGVLLIELRNLQANTAETFKIVRQ